MFCRSCKYCCEVIPSLARAFERKQEAETTKNVSFKWNKVLELSYVFHEPLNLIKLNQ